MIFLDSNVVIDLFRPAKSPVVPWARRFYMRVVAEQDLVSNLVVFAEVAGEAETVEAVLDLFARFEIRLADLTPAAAARGGRVFLDYRRRGGPRVTILPDFLIAGHADTLGASLATQDRRVASYFPDLPLITPETHPHG